MTDYHYLPDEYDDADVPPDGAVQVAGISVVIHADDDMAESAAALAALLSDDDMAALIFELRKQRAITKAMRVGRGKGGRWV
jgi:hypothetical protein